MKAKLTKRLIDSLTTEKKAGESVRDTEVTGLAIRYWPSGKKSFTLDYGPRGRRRRITVGHYGTITLDEARVEAGNMLADVRKGGDPLDDRKADRAAPTFSEWATSYLDIMRREGRHGDNWHSETKRYLDLAAERFGKLKLGEITSEHVERYRDAMAKRGHPTSNRALSAVKTCLQEAWRKELVPSNPAARVRALGGETPRQRVLTDTELTRLTKAVEAHQNATFRAGMLWLIETGARRSEVLRARWGDLDLTDLDRASWRILKPKNKHPIVKPLSRHLAEVLAALPQTGLFVLGRWGELTPANFSDEWRALRETAELLADVHMHDIRRTYGLHAARAAGLHVASKLLGHANVATTERVYSPLQDRDLREAQEKVQAERAKILPFRKVKED